MTSDAALQANSREAEQRHVAVTGASGLIGSSLVPHLISLGHRVGRIVRTAPAGDDIQWDPQRGEIDARRLKGVDAVVHLAAVNIAEKRWSDAFKAEIRSSRVDGTGVLCRALAQLAPPPRVLVMASAIGFYGDRGGEQLDEDSPAGAGFLAETCTAWESASGAAQLAGIRVVHLRLGLVLSPRGGSLAKMLLPFKLGLGGRIGSGQQYWSWISIDDTVGAICHLLQNEALSGAVNAVAPNPVTNREFTRVLGNVLHRPTLLPVPAQVARSVFGQMADDCILASTRAVPKRLMQSGFKFQYPDLESALRHIL